MSSFKIHFHSDIVVSIQEWYHKNMVSNIMVPYKHGIQGIMVPYKHGIKTAASVS